MKITIAFLLLSFCNILYASEYSCTEWTKEPGISCLLANEFANVYTRKCENYCWKNSTTHRGNWGPDCDRQNVCSFEDPSDFGRGCSEWMKVDGHSCLKAGSSTLEQKWIRVCTIGVNESACSDEYPTF
jgi:hypothetical protein